MTKKERKLLRDLADRLYKLAEEYDLLAYEIEAIISKKMTQKSPEFWGGANL